MSPRSEPSVVMRFERDTCRGTPPSRRRSAAGRRPVSRRALVARTCRTPDRGPSGHFDRGRRWSRGRSTLRQCRRPSARSRAPASRSGPASGGGATSRTRLLCRAAADATMRGLHAIERTLGGLPFGAVRRQLDHLLPGLDRAVQILLAEGSDDADVQQGLDVIGIELERMLELLERLVRLVGVVVTDAEVRADIDVARGELHRLAVPLDRLGIAFGVEIEVAELAAGA